MTDQFYNANETNFFDKLVIDVKELYQKYPVEEMRSKPTNRYPDFANSRWHRLYRSALIPLKYRNALWRFTRQTHADLSWFEAFKAYWSSILNGRPLWSVDDLFFLNNLYRIKFQASEVPDSEDTLTHLTAWQRPEILYQLLHYVIKGGLTNQLSTTKHLVHLNRKPGRILEYGCSLAPVVSTLLELDPKVKDTTMIITDIETLTFHYGAWRMRQYQNVIPIPLKPENNFMLELDEPVDVIHCLTVFEHMNAPLEVAKRFHEQLSSGGLLIFDYIKGDGHGLDTMRAVREREHVLEYIANNFEFITGSLDTSKSTPMTVVRKP